MTKVVPALLHPKDSLSISGEEAAAAPAKPSLAQWPSSLIGGNQMGAGSSSNHLVSDHSGNPSHQLQLKMHNLRHQQEQEIKEELHSDEIV